jgi:hypothetical protein
MDVVGPACFDETVEGALDQDVAQVEGIENAGVISAESLKSGVGSS